MLVVLQEIPADEAGWDRFSWANRTSHNLIREAIQARGGPTLSDDILDPIAQADFQGWLQRHAFSHQQFDAAIGAQSADLSILDPKDPAALAEWVQNHLLEHQTAENALGIGS